MIVPQMEPSLEYFMGSFCLYNEGLYYTLTPIPKHEDLEYVRIIIWEIFDHLNWSQYIEKLSWDTPTAIFPAIYFEKAPRHLWEVIHKIRDDLARAIANKWNKDWFQ